MAAIADPFAQPVAIDAEAVVRRVDPPPPRTLDEWAEEELGEEFWSKQVEIGQSIADHRYTAVQSCHDTGKSYTASRAMCWWLDEHPLGEAFVVSTAPTQTQVEAILWREVGRAHRKGDLPGRITSGMVPQWKLGNEIVGYGRKPQDLVNIEEAMAAFSGIHALYVLIVIDEAGGVPEWMYDAVDTLATNENARVLAIGNPDDPSSHFEKITRPGSGWNVIKIPYDETPNFTDEEVSDYVSAQLISPTWVEERKKRWGVGSPRYISKVLGEFPEITDDTLIPPKLLRLATENELPGHEKGRYAMDVARFGDDETVIYRNRGGVIRFEASAHKQDTMQTAGLAMTFLRPHNKAVPMVVDADGLGAGPYDRLRELKQPAIAFHGGHSPYDKERFINRRSEVYWNFREMCENGEIDLDATDEDALAQLGNIKWSLDSRGRVKVETKDEMRKRGVSSPDRADTIVMSTVAGDRYPIAPDPTLPKRKPETAGLMERKF